MNRIAESRRRAGGVLLECIVALAVLVGVGLAILSLVDGSMAALGRARDAAKGAELARSAMSKIEAGVQSPESLHGPVKPWRDDNDGSFDDALPAAGAWELEIETEPSEFEGLTLVTVRAVKRGQSGGEDVEALASLTQLVRLGGAGGAR